MAAAVVVVGAGSGTRLGAGQRKALVVVGGRPLWWHACRAFAGVDGVQELVLVLHPEDAATADSGDLASAGVTRVVAGGARRQESVLAGVRATNSTARDVLVHDAARPFVKPQRIRELLRALEGNRAALLAAPVVATVKEVSDDGRVSRTVDRQRLRLAATPQGARRSLLLSLLERAVAEGRDFTDEASLLEAASESPALVDDDATNLKVTTAADLEQCRALLEPPLPRTGYGYDIHRLVPGRPLVLGGVVIPGELGLLGHSDGDAVLHAAIEAMLGAAGLPDIGEHFPDSDPRWKGVSSAVLALEVVRLLSERSLRIRQLDVTIVAERPRLGAHKAAIKERLQDLFGLPADRVAVKARTAEGLDAIGRGEAIAVSALAVVAS